MATGVLGLGTGQASTLNSDLITKLKDAETASTVTPLDKKLETWQTESDKIAEIVSLTNDLLTTVKPFDLYVTSGVNAFNNKSASTSGTSAVFDAVDVGALNTGITTIDVSQLAQKDVYQSNTISDTSATIIGTDSNDSLTINGTTYSTYGKTYTQLVEEINYNVDLNASLEQIGTSSYRMVIKSANTGTDNALSITETGINLGLNQFASQTTVVGTDEPTGGDLVLNGTTFTVTSPETYDDFIGRINADASFDASIVNGQVLIRTSDGSPLSITTDDLGLNLTNANHTLTAQNMQAQINGITYDVASNTVTVDNGLKVTAVDTGKSSINVEKDTTLITSQVQSFITAYNTYADTLNTEIYSADSSIQDKGTLKDILSQVKSMVFGNYGTNSDLNLFSYGLQLDKSGNLSLDETVFNKALTDDYDNVKSVFIGSAEKEGFGTQLKTFVDNLDGYSGTLTSYQTTMDDRKTKIQTEKDNAVATIDSKYALLSQQFADYGAIITRFNSQFSGLQMMIQQSVSTGN